MAITKERKSGIISDYRRGDADTGSPEVQIALLTARITELNEHFNFQVNVYNLWDTDYIAAVGSNFTPGAGRSVVVSAEVKF